jgi:hypothetical protein
MVPQVQANLIILAWGVEIGQTERSAAFIRWRDTEAQRSRALLGWADEASAPTWASRSLLLRVYPAMHFWH